MRQWRVGTLTMGLLLVFLGIALTVAQFKDLTLIDFFIKWWPLLFILLGLEVLAYSYFLKKDQDRIRYDIFSIFMVLIIVCSGLLLQAFNELDISKQIRQMVVSQNYHLQTEGSTIPLDASIKKIVIEAPTCDLIIQTAPTGAIEAYGSASVVADSLNTAEEVLSKNTRIISRRTGDTIHVGFNTTIHRNDMSYGATIESYSLLLPKNVVVEIHNSYSSLKIDTAITADWKVNSEGPMEITLPAGSNTGINAWADNPDQLQGNVNWAIVEQSPPNIDGADQSSRVHAKAQSGQPQHSINIVGKQSITVNQQ